MQVGQIFHTKVDVMIPADFYFGAKVKDRPCWPAFRGDKFQVSEVPGAKTVQPFPTLKKGLCNEAKPLLLVPQLAFSQKGRDVVQGCGSIFFQYVSIGEIRG